MKLKHLVLTGNWEGTPYLVWGDDLGTSREQGGGVIPLFLQIEDDRLDRLFTMLFEKGMPVVSVAHIP